MELPTEFLLETLKSVLKDIGLNPNSSHECQEISAHLLLSSLYRVTVRYTDDNETNTKNFIFKTLRQNPEINERFDTAVFFKNEAMFYTKVLSAFKIFQEQRLCLSDKPWHSTPICYRAFSDSETDVFVLEDLTERGYVESSRLKSLKILELHVLMKELGRFHALSLAIKDKDPELFLKLKYDSVKEAVFRTKFIKKTYNTWASSVASWTLKLANESFPIGSPYVKKLDAFANDNMAFFMKDIINPRAEDEQFNVFTHGDLWVNNLLFHYQDSENGTSENPDNMCFVDFQNCRYGSVALDVSAVLFLLMDQKMRDAHREELLQVYHNSLAEFLKQLGCDSNKLFPFGDLEPQLSKYALFNLGMTFLCLTHNLAVESDEDLTCCKDEEPAIHRTTEECRIRILDVIKECVDRGYL